MKFILVSVFVVCVAVIHAEGEIEGFPKPPENTNIDEIIANEQVFDSYVACLDGTGECTIGQTNEVREKLAEAVGTCCGKCDPKEKDDFGKLYRHIAEVKPDSLDRLRQLYDPSGIYEPDCIKQYDSNRN